MIALSPGTRVYLVCQPVDMRRSFDGLSALVQQIVKGDPYSGHAFLFRSRRGDYLKLLHWDGSGLVLLAKRLEKGTFVWPSKVEAVLALSPAQIALLIEGCDWRRTRAPDDVKRPQLA
jgi:transposase